MTFWLKILTLTALLMINGINSKAAEFDYGRTEIQTLWGSGFHLGSSAPDTNANITFTITHASNWAYGSNFFFIDLIHETDGDGEADFYGEFYPGLSAAKILGRDLGLGFITDIAPTGGLNMGSEVGVYLLGLKFALDLPGAATGSVLAFAYDTFRDPRGRDLDTTFQVTLTWNIPITLGDGRWRFVFQGFADYIGSRGFGTEYRIVAQPQIRFDLGRVFGVDDRVLIGTEIGIFRNKAGIGGLHEYVPKAMLVYRF